MSWYYLGKIIREDQLEGYYGFVYLIENLYSGKKYIGKKFLFSRRTKIQKGKKKRFLIESDWKEYWGSNKELLEDIEKYSLTNFKKTILLLCESKGECSYWEAKYQFDNDCLISDEWYNSWIMVRVHKNHLNKKTKNVKKENTV